jgi:butyryl-CoA dehydrogenase
MIDGLSYTLTDWVDSFREEVKEFSAEHREVIAESNRAGQFPADVYREMGKRGWLAPFAPKESGGLGGGIAEYCAVMEELAFNGLISPQISTQGQRWLLDWGTEAQMEKYFGPMVRGELVFSESISEPGVGSSLKAMQSTATRDGDDWILRGKKTHVNLGHQSDLTLMYAMAEEGLTAFLVDMTLPGVSSEQTSPIGIRLLPTADMIFDDVRVPNDAILGEAGRGMDTFLRTFNVSRLGNASEAIGVGRRALSMALEYAETREVGSSVVTDFQGIQWIVADRFSDLYAASAVRDRAALVADGPSDPAFETSLAKKLALEAADKTVNDVFSLVGGYGLYVDKEFGQLLHDMKVLRVGGGSLEILRNFVARSVLRSRESKGL